MDYYDDRFHPGQGNDMEENFKNTCMLQNIKSLDPHFHKYKKMVFFDRGDGSKLTRKVMVEYYSSGPQSGYIRNAQTGVYTKDIIGTTQEDLYFKVRMGDGNSHTLFYDSPEQYESHHYDNVSNNVKENWLKKRSILL